MVNGEGNMTNDKLRTGIEKLIKIAVNAFNVLTSPEADEFVEVLYTDTDRGCLLSIAESLNFLLEISIRETLRNLSDASKADIDILLVRQPSPPIGSFGTRINFARVLGIITPETKSVLNKVRQLRNRQAHSYKGVLLEEEQVKVILDILEKKTAEQIRVKAKKRKSNLGHPMEKRTVPASICP